MRSFHLTSRQGAQIAFHLPIPPFRAWHIDQLSIPCPVLLSSQDTRIPYRDSLFVQLFSDCHGNGSRALAFISFSGIYLGGQYDCPHYHFHPDPTSTSSKAN